MPEPAVEVVVITGASSGIGREIALQLAAPGRTLWLIGRDQKRLDEVAALALAKGADSRIMRLDLADEEASKQFLAGNFPVGSKVDAVYLAAAVTQFGEVRDTLAEDWQRIYQTNLISPIQWIHHFYGNMITAKSGRLVIVSSLAAYAGYPTATAYATMKAGLLGLFRSLWYEGKSHGVSIHLAAPGYVDTGIYKSAVFRNTSYENTMSQIKAMGFRILSAGEAARVILRSVGRGKSEFAFPAYASAMKWTAPRIPSIVDVLHRRIVKSFRSPS